MKWGWVVAVVTASLVASGCSTGSDASGRSAAIAPETAAPETTRPETTAATADDVVPGEGWTVSDPESHGLDPVELDRALEYAAQPGQHTQSVVVVHGGEIVAEWYAEGAGPDSWVASWSVAKSVSSIAVGVAIDRGDIGSVEDPVAEYLPQWQGTDHEDITIRDVLEMTSGLEWVEDYRGLESDIVKMVVGEADQLAYAASRPLEVEPGSRWWYSSGDSMLLSGVVQHATGQTLDEYAAQHVLDPIGMSKVEWWRDARGHTLGYCCFDTTSRDFARLGLLYLRGGRWGDGQVVSEAWVKESLEPTTASAGEYGYQWWLDDLEGLPVDLFRAAGVDGQYIYVIPSLDLVVVRNGTYVKDPGPPIADPGLFMTYPSGSLVPGKGTSEPENWSSEEFLSLVVAAARP